MTDNHLPTARIEAALGQIVFAMTIAAAIIEGLLLGFRNGEALKQFGVACLLDQV